MSKIYIIMGSVRPYRIGQQIAPLVVNLAKQIGLDDVEIVDLRDWPLAMDDEPDQPSKGVYAQLSTQKWSEKIAQANGFVFLTPQYNWSYPAALKNALDHLYKEWHDKPALIISYGHRGGGRAADHLQQVLQGLRMKPVSLMPALTFDEAMLGEHRLLRDPAVNLLAFFAPISDGLMQLKAALSSSAV